MNDEKYINNITLEYLLNPVLYDKINNGNNRDKIILEDIEFYRKRICQITKDMCKGDYINENIKKSFINYANTLVYYLKQLDEKDLLQMEYDNLNLNELSHNPNNNNLDISNNYDKIIMNKPSNNNNLDSFVIQTNSKIVNTFVPHKRVINTNDPTLKKKGLKKYSNNINGT